MTSFYKDKKVLVTGGAGFIGSALVEKLLESGATVTIADNFSTGHQENIARVFKDINYREWDAAKENPELSGHTVIRADLEELEQCRKVVRDQEIVFHLAATIGGRGYIVEHPGDCCENFAINQNMIKAAAEEKVERLLYSSSACVYPFDLQDEYGSNYLLKEQDAFKNGWANADLEYGWGKLQGEMSLQAYHKQYGLKGAITRYVTAYGPYENESHAIIALIKRALQHEDPYVIWGSGDQDRDFTYVDDIVSGTLAACEKLTDCSAVNLGTGVRYTMKETVELIFNAIGWRPAKIVFDRSKPEGVKSRALSTQHAGKTIGYEPKVSFEEGIKRTAAWLAEELKQQNS